MLDSMNLRERVNGISPTDLTSTKPSERQVGGSHYKDLPIQPTEIAVRNGLDWCEGNAVKYILRHSTKHGKQDILKAIHYLELLLEYQYPDEE